MPPLLRFIIYRILAIPFTLLVVTASLYAFVMLTPPEVRATLYLGAGINPDRLSEAQIRNLTEQAIEKHHLRDPFLVQYADWLVNLLKGEWGWSPYLNESVLPALIRRTPVTAELTIYTLLTFIPLGLVSGVIAGARKDQPADRRFRLAAYVATSLPVFILALVLLAVFYVSLRWFPPERLGLQLSQEIQAPAFIHFTGLLTIDGLLNGRPEISLDALRHLVLPVFTLCLLHWATLGRVMRAAMIGELGKEYAIAALARGYTRRRVVWVHAFRNALTPALTSSALSAASLFTGVFTVEAIFNFKGISSIILSTIGVPDAPSTLGFATYSVLIVLLIMFILDIIQAVFDPRVREGILGE
jgi:peptide/nickel transport system permease protein